MEGLCLLLASPHKHNETLLQAGEPLTRLIVKLLQVTHMARGNNRALMQVKRITFKSVRSILIGHLLIDGVQVCKELNISDFVGHPSLVKSSICVV